MQIGELAATTGVSRDTLRYYEKRGLVRSIRRPNGYRHYPDGTDFVLNFILTAKRLGFSLAEIEAELPGLSEDGITEARIAKILQSKIAVIDARIAELGALRSALSARLNDACPMTMPAEKARG